MPGFEKVGNIIAEQKALQSMLDEILTMYLRDMLSFVNTNYDLWVRHLRAMGYEDPEGEAREIFHALRATAGVPVPATGSEPPISYETPGETTPAACHPRAKGKLERSFKHAKTKRAAVIKRALSLIGTPFKPLE